MRLALYTAALPGFVVLVSMAKAQEVIAPPAQVPVTPEAMQTQNDMQVFNPADKGGGFPPASHLFSAGPVTLRPHMDYQVTYGTGIQSTPGQQHNTFIHQLSPGMLFAIGTHWALDYTPTLSFYSDPHFQDNVSHHAALTWGVAYENWTLGFAQSYSHSSSPLVETGAQTDTEGYGTTLTASYRFNNKISVDLSANQDFQFVNQSTNLTQAVSDSREWSTMNWLNYEFWPRLNGAIGAGGGYVNVQNSPNQTYEQLQARVDWHATDKVSFQIHGGGEDRQFQNSGTANLVNPIFGAAIQYQPFEQTKISIDAERAVNVSYFQDQVTENTSINANLDQRVFGRYYVDLSASYGNTKYVASATGISVARSDDSYSFGARFTGHFLSRGSYSVGYDYSNNSSSQSGFSFSSDQVTFELAYSY